MSTNLNPYPEKYHLPRIFKNRWMRFWMRFAGLHTFGRFATRLAAWFAPPHKAGVRLARMSKRGYLAPTATIFHGELKLGSNIYIGDGVTIFQRRNGRSLEIGDRVCIYRDVILETGRGGSLSIGSCSSIHPRCQINAYVAPIKIGSGVMLAPNCGLYSYDHGLAPDRPIRKQLLKTKGPILIEDEAWLGFGSIVLSGVRIGRGAVVAAGSVVTSDVPEQVIVAGIPARIVKHREDLASSGHSPCVDEPILV